MSHRRLFKKIQNFVLKSSPSSVVVNKYGKNAPEAAQKIAHIYHLSSLWKKLVKNPQLYYELSNDTLANNMFGKHVAGIFHSKVKNCHIKLNERAQYYRENGGGDWGKDSFHMAPTDSKINFAFEGTHISQWNFSSSMAKKTNRVSKTKTRWGENILKSYCHNAADVLQSKEMEMLHTLGFDPKYQHFNFSSHAQELHAMISIVCGNKAFHNLDHSVKDKQINARVKDNIARLHLFLSMLVNLHHKNHVKFSALMEPLVHEISLMVFEIMNLTGKPLCSHALFEKYVQKEFLGSPFTSGTFGIHKKFAEDIGVTGYPANSGMHACVLSLHFSKTILGIEEKSRDSYSFLQYKDTQHYYETLSLPNKILKLHEENSEEQKSVNADIHVVNGSIQHFEPEYNPGTNLNAYLQQLHSSPDFDKNKHHVIILDTTVTDYDDLALDPQFQQCVADDKLTIFLWESWQKFGLLGTDQAQFGRVIVLSSKKRLQELATVNANAEKDMEKLDMQIGALFQMSRLQPNRYREFNFNNGKTMRSVFFEEKESKERGPFLNLGPAASSITPELPDRDSFGFNYMTFTGRRVSAGSEQNIDVQIYSLFLAKLHACKRQLNQLIPEINSFFEKMKNFDAHKISKQETMDLIANCYLVQTVISREGIAKYPDLNTQAILNVVIQLLRTTKEKGYRQISKFLEGSNKSLDVLTDLRRQLTPHVKQISKEADIRSESKMKNKS